MYIQGNPDEIQRPAHWNMISRSMTAQPPVLSPSSIPKLLSSQCAFIPSKKKKKTPCCFQKYYYFFIFF